MRKANAYNKKGRNEGSIRDDIPHWVDWIDVEKTYKMKKIMADGRSLCLFIDKETYLIYKDRGKLTRRVYVGIPLTTLKDNK